MPSVLVVDDTAVDRMLVQGILTKNPEFTVEAVESGEAALNRVESRTEDPFDIVVTDLNMPEMNGLDMVTFLKIRHPSLPVILTTAHGSEELAVQALEQGAASYVPKLQIADRLLPTVEQVLAFAQSDRNYQRLSSCMTKAGFEFELENDPGLFGSLLDMVSQIAVSMRLCDVSRQVQLGMAIEEALRLAVFCGNLELTVDELESLPRQPEGGICHPRQRQAPYSDRRVHVSISMTPVDGTVTVRHEGPGNTAQFPENADPSVMNEVDMRPFVLINSFMDEVGTTDEGRVIRMTIRPHQE